MACKCPHILTCQDVNVPCEKFPGTEFWPILTDDQWAKLAEINPDLEAR